MTFLYTVGHGVLSEEAFTKLLKEHGIRHLIDIRARPGSTRNPQFNLSAMDHWIPAAGISYKWEPRLGGFRVPRVDSANTYLKDPAFRGFADHMETEEFVKAARFPVLDLTALMCSEGDWKNCHRRLLSDWYTLIAGIEVLHIGHHQLEKHCSVDFARQEGGIVRYDRGTLSLF